MKNSYFVIDFDSTFTRLEAFDALCEIVLDGSPQKDEVLGRIQDITDRAMEGDLDFRTSLSQRLELLKVHQHDVERLADRLKSEISGSFIRNRNFLVTKRDCV